MCLVVTGFISPTYQCMHAPLHKIDALIECCIDLVHLPVLTLVVVICNGFINLIMLILLKLELYNITSSYVRYTFANILDSGPDCLHDKIRLLENCLILYY